MNTNEFDKEYYLVNVDGASNHPLLTWGDTDDELFIYPKPVDEDHEDLELPLKIKFSKPYPKQPEFVDILFLDGDLVVSEKVKLCLEKINIYGVQFFPVEIETDKKKKVDKYYLFHAWNRISAVDKNNYVGGDINEWGRIQGLDKFSLDKNVIESIFLDKRLIFHLGESTSNILIHKNVYDVLKAENVTGFSFFRIDEWDDNAMFR